MTTQPVFDVNQQNFQTAVLDRSYDELVLVDFWAPWCGPCRMLGPVLERLANEPNSHFKLAKLNTTDNQDLAIQYRIHGIPAVKAFRNGQIVDEFVGAQPEPMVRQFIQRNLTAAQPKPAANGDPLSQAKNYLRDGRGADARPLLQQLNNAEAKKLLPLAEWLAQPATGHPEIDQLYSIARSELAQRHPETALYRMLTALNQEPFERKSQTKAAMEGVVALWRADKPAVAQYQQILANIAA